MSAKKDEKKSPVKYATRNRTKATNRPVKASRDLWSDIRYYFLQSPSCPTVVNLDPAGERQRYSWSIRQRTGISVEQYRMLNMHRIGVNAPPGFIFDEIMKWNGRVGWWPNHVARVYLGNDTLDDIRIYLFGRLTLPGGKTLGFRLFNLKAITIHKDPDDRHQDNARYLLYDCSGGYPIGVFSIYVRSSILDFNEKESSQLFIVVGFNFYGKKSWSNLNFLNKTWEKIHNRVTANIANRFRKICEAAFEDYKVDWSNREG